MRSNHGDGHTLVVHGECQAPCQRWSVSTDWEDVLDDFAYMIGCLDYREFLIMQALVGLDPNPYAQVAREPDGSFYCDSGIRPSINHRRFSTPQVYFRRSSQT